jgi:hypothetical protein
MEPPTPPQEPTTTQQINLRLDSELAEWWEAYAAGFLRPVNLRRPNQSRRGAMLELLLADERETGRLRARILAARNNRPTQG